MNAVPKPDFGGHESPSHGHAYSNLYAMHRCLALSSVPQANGQR